MSEVIAFIGGGNMAASLVGGLLAAGQPASAIRVAEPNAEAADRLRARFGIATAAAGSEVASGAGTVVLAVKPQQMAAALGGLLPDAGTTVVSIAAGVRLAFLRRALGADLEYVRSMPNTPALYGCGVSGLYAPPDTSERARQRAETVLRAAGAVCWLQDESELDAVTAVSGSGPAYLFLLVEAMREAGVALGLDPAVSAQLAAQTCIGAARMLEAGTTDAAVLRAQVTSKGGTTEAALNSLESAGFRPMFREALAAAAQRSREMGDALDPPAG